MKRANRRDAAMLAGCLAVLACGTGATSTGGVTVLREERAVEFAARVAPGAWAEGEMAGYHLIVWEDGGAADAALFRAEVSDVEVLDAIESLGATPGDALDLGTWEERDDPSSWKPDRVIEGPPVEILVRFDGGERWLRLDEVVDDRLRLGFDMRLGGHRANIPAWKSGCVVCLYSCPGGKVGNASYTVRDFTKRTTRFRAREDVLAHDGERATIRIRLAEPA